jgi:hypothetical protein
MGFSSRGTLGKAELTSTLTDEDLNRRRRGGHGRLTGAMNGHARRGRRHDLCPNQGCGRQPEGDLENESEDERSGRDSEPSRHPAPDGQS